jgi:hypothetical protein
MKCCSVCKIEKPIEEYYRDKITASGFRADCKSCCRKRSLANYVPVPVEFKKTHKGYSEDQKIEAHRASSRGYYARTKDKVKAYKNEWKKRKRLSDPVFRLKEAISANINLNIKKYLGHGKTYRTPEYIGCSFEQLFVHITSQFVDGMNWDNYGNGDGCWNIDHIDPISLAMTEEDLFILNHYTNLRPMWHNDNVKKSNSILLWL